VKLLFDENLSPRLVELLTAEFPGSTHVDRALGRGRPDLEVWEHAGTQQIAALLRSKLIEVNRFGDAPHESLLVLER
jgi:predicted nuclease of predicted toxin-antitoxin system